MMKKIIIKKSENAVSRTATKLTRENLYKDTKEHKQNVNDIIQAFKRELDYKRVMHDHTKFKKLPQNIMKIEDVNFTDVDDEYAENVLEKLTEKEFKSREWYRKHVTTERHHIKTFCHEDINLLDVLEMIADITSAGIGRYNNFDWKFAELDEKILLKAYENTIQLVLDNIKVAD